MFTRRRPRRPYRVPAAPVAAFSGTPLVADIGQSVAFTDASTGSPFRFAWDFGDGETSTDRNPSHSFAAAGYYGVTLTAYTGGGSDPEVKAAYVHVRPAAPASTALADYVGGAWIAAARSAGLLWQDVGKTTLATAAADPVYVARDPYSTVEFTAADNAGRATLATDGAGRWWLQSLAAARTYTATLGGGLLPLVGNGCCSVGRASCTVAAGNSISAFIGSGSDGVGTFVNAAGSQDWMALLGGIGFGAGTGVVETGLWKTVGSDYSGDAAEVRLFVVDPTTAVNTTASLIHPPSNALLFQVAGRWAGGAFYARQVSAAERAVVFAGLDPLGIN